MSASLSCYLQTFHCHLENVSEDGTRAHHQQSEGNEIFGSLSGGKVLDLLSKLILQEFSTACENSTFPRAQVLPGKPEYGDIHVTRCSRHEEVEQKIPRKPCEGPRPATGAKARQIPGPVPGTRHQGYLICGTQCKMKMWSSLFKWLRTSRQQWQNIKPSTGPF